MENIKMNLKMTACDVLSLIFQDNGQNIQMEVYMNKLQQRQTGDSNGVRALVSLTNALIHKIHL